MLFKLLFSSVSFSLSFFRRFCFSVPTFCLFIYLSLCLSLFLLHNVFYLFNGTDLLNVFMIIFVCFHIKLWFIQVIVIFSSSLYIYIVCLYVCPSMYIIFIVLNLFILNSRICLLHALFVSWITLFVACRARFTDTRLCGLLETPQFKDLTQYLPNCHNGVIADNMKMNI